VLVLVERRRDQLNQFKERTEVERRQIMAETERNAVRWTDTSHNSSAVSTAFDSSWYTSSAHTTSSYGLSSRRTAPGRPTAVEEAEDPHLETETRLEPDELRRGASMRDKDSLDLGDVAGVYKVDSENSVFEAEEMPTRPKRTTLMPMSARGGSDGASVVTSAAMMASANASARTSSKRSGTGRTSAGKRKASLMPGMFSMGFGTGKRKSEETGRNISIEGVEILNNPFHAAALGGKAPSGDRTTSSGSSPGDVIDFMNRASLADKTAKPHDLEVNMKDEVTQAEASRAARSRGRSPSPVSSKLGFYRGRSPRGARRPPSPTNAPP